MHYKFSTSARGSALSAPLILRLWWPNVAWFGQILVFHSDYDEIEL